MPLAGYSRGAACNFGYTNIFYPELNEKSHAPRPLDRGVRRHMIFSREDSYQEMAFLAYEKG